MRRTWNVVVAVMVVVIAGYGFRAAYAGNAPSGATTAAEFHQLAYFRVGPYVYCDGGGRADTTLQRRSCGSHPGVGFAFTPLARGHAYSGTLTVSFDYDTSGSADFTAYALLHDDAGNTVGAVHPPLRRLTDAPHGNSRTMVFGLWGVPAGATTTVALRVYLTAFHGLPVQLQAHGLTEELRLS